MVFAAARLILMALVLLGIVYALVSVYSRSLRREKLEEEWNAAGRPGAREDYVARGLEQYDASIRPRLLLLIFVVPPIVAGTLIYVVNFR